ncbi:hypothetical protein [Acinetobacter sp. MN12]|uniref:hypothetical protein n=1 Tax=Acinetobacter sp. MN12 TaxID=1513354 RepID=UPI00051BF5BA|nr:hypothetical protein [Acinetobacter sp. MN12]
MDNLQIFLSNKYDFKRKEEEGSTFSLLYGAMDGDVQYSVLAEYLGKEMPREVIIRAKKDNYVCSIRFSTDYIWKMQKEERFMNMVFDSAFKELKSRIMM